MNWWVQRIAASERYSSSLIEIQTQWSLADIYEAHMTLDTIEHAEAQAMKSARKG